MLKSILVAAALAFAATAASAAIGPITSPKVTAASDLVQVKSKGRGGAKARQHGGSRAKAHHRGHKAKVHHRVKPAHHRAKGHHRRHNVHVCKRVNVHVHRHGGRYWWGGRYWRRYYYRPNDWELRGCIFIDGLWLCLW